SPSGAGAPIRYPLALLVKRRRITTAEGGGRGKASLCGSRNETCHEVDSPRSSKAQSKGVGGEDDLIRHRVSTANARRAQVVGKTREEHGRDEPDKTSRAHTHPTTWPRYHPSRSIHP
ncbi:unnamed protein product, partial [Ectocarpus sp. 13 AM-2016]